MCVCVFVCVCAGGNLDSPGDSRFVGSGVPQLNAQEVVEALGKWEGMEDTISLFSDLIKDNSTLIQCSVDVLS